MKNKKSINRNKNFRNKLRRKRRHIRQIESRMRNDYKEYIDQMNKFQYNTWLSEVTNQTENDIIYTKQIINKEKILKAIKLKAVNEEEYYIINDNEDNTNVSSCLIC